MPSTDQIIDQARDLGRQLADHEAVKRLADTLKRLEKDTTAQQALASYQQHLQALGAKEAAGQPIEVAEKRQLESLQQQVVTNIVLRDFQIAQMDYVDLMRRIDEAMVGQTPLADTAMAPDAQQGGGPPHV
ncbi:MAG: YlbF family regulator [Phycisphaeraceae bacterium]